MIQKKFKDRLFRMIFNNKTNLLALYNAVNDSNYTEESDLQVTTIENVIYLGMKNDVSFLLDDSIMNFYEHQATINPNMPARGLIYAGIVYKQYLDMNDLSIYSRTAVRLPTPKYIVFYNGREDAPDVSKLRLSDLFARPESNRDADNYPDFEWTATMLNINYGHNMELLEKCRPLMEYSVFIAKVRENLKSMNLDDAVDTSVKECISEDILADFLQKNRTEVTDMFMSEYDEQKNMDVFFKDGKAEGIAEGIETGIEIFIGTLKEMGASKDDTLLKLSKKYDISENSAKEYIEKYWK